MEYSECFLILDGDWLIILQIKRYSIIMYNLYSLTL